MGFPMSKIRLKARIMGWISKVIGVQNRQYNHWVHKVLREMHLDLN
jgi:hypothetical protein